MILNFFYNPEHQLIMSLKDCDDLFENAKKMKFGVNYFEKYLIMNYPKSLY